MRNLGTPTGTAAAPVPLPARARRQRPGPATRERTLLLGAVDTAPRCARAALTESLTQWGLRHLRDDGEAITSELVANAVAASIQAARAAGTEPAPVLLTITARDGELCIRVWDPDPAPPPREQPPPDDNAEHGRGLIIVAALSTRWGWHPARNGGKHVWAALPGSSPSQASHHSQGATRDDAPDGRGRARPATAGRTTTARAPAPGNSHAPAQRRTRRQHPRPPARPPLPVTPEST